MPGGTRVMRGRGNRLVHRQGAGSIPAWAGEPDRVDHHLPDHRVYPRVGGGTWEVRLVQERPTGLSPRGRGNLHPIPSRAPRRRSIPAWAGEPASRNPRRCTAEVYPRVGGGTSAWPRCTNEAVGLSPRGRGNPVDLLGAEIDDGSIPAWAGEPWMRWGVTPWLRVYPRVGGGTPGTLRFPNSCPGLSPRGRGNHPTPEVPGVTKRSIPAWAGEPWLPVRTELSGAVYPRVGGGTRAPTVTNSRRTLSRSIPAWAGEPGSHTGNQPRPFKGLSPRGRGNRLCRIAGVGHVHRYRAWVYPRVGGGTLQVIQTVQVHGGLSPRGRGNPDRWDHRYADIAVYPRVGGGTDPSHPDGTGSTWPRSIPAWAGEPTKASVSLSVSAVYPRVGGGTHLPLTPRIVS